MPRRKTIPSPDVRPLIDKIQAHLTREAISLNRLCKQACVNQPALFRFMSGERKTVTKVAKAAEVFIDTRHKRHKLRWQGTLRPASQVSGEHGLRVIDEAVKVHWDGSTRSATLIAMLIGAVVPVIQAAGNNRE